MGSRPIFKLMGVCRHSTPIVIMASFSVQDVWPYREYQWTDEGIELTTYRLRSNMPLIRSSHMLFWIERHDAPAYMGRR